MKKEGSQQTCAQGEGEGEERRRRKKSNESPPRMVGDNALSSQPCIIVHIVVDALYSVDIERELCVVGAGHAAREYLCRPLGHGTCWET